MSLNHQTLERILRLQSAGKDYHMKITIMESIYF